MAVLLTACRDGCSSDKALSTAVSVACAWECRHQGCVLEPHSGGPPARTCSFTANAAIGSSFPMLVGRGYVEIMGTLCNYIV